MNDHNKKLKSVFVLLLLCMSSCSVTKQDIPHKQVIAVSFGQLTNREKDAVLSAEKFIAGSGTAMIKQFAYGFIETAKSEVSGWIVVFEYSPEFIGNLLHLKTKMGTTDLVGRAVTMNSDYTSIKLEHKDFFLHVVKNIISDTLR